MPIYLKQSTASQEIPLGYFLDPADGDTAATALTIANTDIKIWKAGATTLANKNSGGATHISGGIYYAVLDATDSDTLGSLIVFIHVAGGLAIRIECVVLAANVYDSLIGGGDLLDVSVTQLAGVAQSLTDLKDFADDGYDPSTNKVQGVVLTDTVTTYTGNTVQTGDSFARIGANGASLTALATQASVNTIDDFVDTEVATLVSNVAAIKTKTDNLPSDTAAVLTAIDDFIDTEVAAIKAKTDQLTFTTANQVDSNALSLSATALAAIWNRLTSAITTSGSIGKLIVDNLNATVSSRLASANITLTGGLVDVNDKTGFSLGAGAITNFWNELTSGLSTSGSIGKLLVDNINATIASRLASASISLSGGAVTVGTNSDKTGYALSTAGTQAIWDKATSALTTSGSVGKWILDKLDVIVSTRLASADISLSTGAVTVGTNSDKTGYALSSAGVDAILDDAPSAELASIPGDTATLRLMIQYIFQYLLFKRTVTSTTETAFKTNGSTTLGTASVSDDGTTFTKGKMS